MLFRSLAVMGVTILLLLTGCAPGQSKPAGKRPAPKTQPVKAQTLAEARRGFVTHLISEKQTSDPVPQPPAGFELVHYKAPLGSFPAYVTVPAEKSGKHPAIVWISGGFDNGIGDTPWAPATADDDQSARAFPQAGIITMYPSLRGGNSNPGSTEGLYGEVDDVIAAGKYLAGRADIDPKRIYLGGHSTGGTLALLTAESTSLFRAVFVFGPVSRIEEYGAESLPFDTEDTQETALRSPLLYLGAIANPTFVFEGTDAPSNLEPVRDLRAHCTNARVHFYQLPGLNHFSELAPITPIIAGKIVMDSGIRPQFSFLSQAPEIQPVE